MALTAWTRELGTTQGRIAPLDLAPPEGAFVFVLGRELPDLVQRLNIGDFVEVKQTADFGDTTLLRVRAHLRPPAAVPSGAAWRFSLRIDGTERVGARLAPGRVRDRMDLAANVSKLSGDHEVAFRLEVVAS